MQSLRSLQIETATEDREAKAQQKASKLQKAAEDKGDLADTTATRDSDQVYLDDLVAECTQKSSDFEQRQQLRTDELAAIDKAIEILSSGAVSGAADKHLPGLIQNQVSFLQISASARNPTQARVAEFLRQKGSSINSRVLSALAVRVAEDPFTKVKKMIKVSEGECMRIQSVFPGLIFLSTMSWSGMSHWATAFSALDRLDTGSCLDMFGHILERGNK